MKYSLFSVLGIKSADISKISRETGIPKETLKYYEDSKKVPMGSDLEKISYYFKVHPDFLKLKLGYVDNDVLTILLEHSTEMTKFFSLGEKKKAVELINPDFSTEYGSLYQADCLEFMQNVPDNSFDLVFADPPFNLRKLYPSKMNDSLKEEEYVLWQEKWVSECIRVMKRGGSLFIWNLPKWNSQITYLLNTHLTFKHWISVDIKYSLPIQGRLYPSHYALLYYIKGERANTFHPDRLPMEICPNCQTDLRDYGGYKDKMNPSGVNLSDVWYDIPPVRHTKYKKRKGANELSLKLLDRIIEMASNEGDIVFDPFGGSGTTYVVSELKKRRWVGTEIGPLNDITNRFSLIDEERVYLDKVRENLNCLFTKRDLKARREKGLWTPESVRKLKDQNKTLFDI